MLKITLTSGLVGKTDTQRKIVAGLGLGKFGTTVVHADSPTIRGMLKKVNHLVTIAPATGDDKAKAKSAKEAATSSHKAAVKNNSKAVAEKPVAKKAATKASA